MPATGSTLEPIATQQEQKQPNFQIPNPYDIEYEDYDSDDDDYGNNKRLKIDESEDPLVETMQTKTESAAQVNPKPVAAVVELNPGKNQDQINNKQGEDMVTRAIAPVAAEQSENQINKDNSTADTSKPLLEHDNEASNSSSVASSKSAFSAMTAISAISSDSLSVSAMSSVCDKSNQDSVDVKSSQQQDTKIALTSSVEETKAESLEKPQENLKSKSQLDQQEGSKSFDTDSLKVPSLKIIVSGNGSLPYVKGQPTTAAGSISDAAADSEVLASTEQRATKNEKKQRAATAAASSDTMTTPVKHGDPATFNVNDSPANNSR